MKWLNYILNGWLTSGCGCHHGEQHVHPLWPRAHRQPLRESRTVAASPWALHRPLRHQEGGRSHPVASVRLASHLFRNSQVCSMTTIYSVCFVNSYTHYGSWGFGLKGYFLPSTGFLEKNKGVTSTWSEWQEFKNCFSLYRPVHLKDELSFQDELFRPKK